MADPDKKNNLALRSLPYLILFTLAFILYLKTVGFNFIPSWDDSEYVVDNIHIRGFSLENLKFIFTGSVMGIYAPLQLLSYALDYSVWGLDPGGFHLTNIALHGINACLVYALAARLMGKKEAAFIAALLFAVHPLNVENTAWIAERKTLLSSLFTFLAFISYLDFREKDQAYSYILAVVFFMLALFSKPLAVAFPLMLAAYEMYLSPGRRKWLHASALIAPSVIFAFLTFRAHAASNSLEVDSLSTLFSSVYPTMAPIIWKYARLIVWPFNLSGYYDTTVYRSFLDPVVALSIIGLLALFVFVFLKCGRQARFWVLWFWVWFLPVSNIVPIPVYYADRYMYLPAIAFFVAFAALASRLLSMPKGEKASNKRQLAVFTIVFAITAFYGTIAYTRMDIWRDELSFWEDTAMRSPNQYKARLNLGYAYEMAGRYPEAEREYMAAIAIYPDPDAISNLNMVRLKKEYSNRK